MRQNKWVWFLLFLSSIVMLHTVYANSTKNYQFNYQNKKIPDFSTYKPISVRKKAFITYVSHFAQIANKQILSDRQHVNQLRKNYLKQQKLLQKDKSWLMNLANTYNIKHWNINQPHDWNMLLNRIDIVPTSMLLAQAANESAWGTSRFAQQGNNLFGQWCFSPGCGIVPKQRAAGRIYEVQKFPSVLASVQAYILNLNTNTHYQAFRQARAQLRTQGKPISGYALADGLRHYSQRGKAYVSDIRYIIVANQLGNTELT